MDSTVGGGVKIMHREFIQDIRGSDIFAKTEFSINPGLDYTFPWISQIAPAFQEYKWKKLCFIYKSTSGDLVSGTNGALGSVIMGTNYNSVETLFVDKRSMENSQGTTSCKPALSCIHNVNLKNMPTKSLYTRSDPTPEGADRRLYDIGKFVLATQGMQVAVPGEPGNIIGELWVAYEVEFLKPKFENDSGVETEHWFLGGDAADFDQTNPFGKVAVTNRQRVTGNIGLDVGDKRITFPVDAVGKRFIIQYSIVATAAGLANCQYTIASSNGIAKIAGVFGVINAAGVAVGVSGNLSNDALGSMDTWMTLAIEVSEPLGELKPWIEIEGISPGNMTGTLVTGSLVVFEINRDVGVTTPS